MEDRLEQPDRHCGDDLVMMGVSVSSADTMSTRRSSHVVSVEAPSASTAGTTSRRRADSLVSAILQQQQQQQHERRRQSRDILSLSSAGFESRGVGGHVTGVGSFELPGIHISRIETVEVDDEPPTGRSATERINMLARRHTTRHDRQVYLCIDAKRQMLFRKRTGKDVISYFQSSTS